MAQWRDALVALYCLPDDDWMGLTHAYFPAHAFDTYVIRDGWAFAQKGDGYLALTAARGMTFVRAGLAAYRELRSPGLHNIWLCQLGRRVLDGDFQSFQAHVLALDVAYDDLGVSWTTLRGDNLTFGWEGPLLRNGVVVPLEIDAHVESPYCVAEFPAAQMDIHVGDIVMRLKLTEDS